MYFRLAVIFSLLFFLNNKKGITQITTIQGISCSDAVQNLIGVGVNVSNLSCDCDANALGSFNNANNLPISSGVILSTGNINQVTNGGCTASSSITNGHSSNGQLNGIAGNSTFDQCTIEFDITPTCSSLQISFFYGSEEYPEFVNTGYNDAFAFYISGPGITGTQNLAVVPGTSTPVTINTINGGTNSSYYNSNGSCGNGIEFDGYTNQLTTFANVIQCATYHMTITIADAGDGIYDSGVFLLENGLTCPGGGMIVTEDIQDTCSATSCNSSINLNITGGVSPYTTTWKKDGVNFSTNTNLSNLCTGTYSVEVLDNTCNKFYDTIIIDDAQIPSAVFSVSQACTPAPVPINNTSTISAPDIISNYSWDFGDGNTSTAPTPNYVYPNSGTYTIKLVTESNKGCKDSTTNQVNVYPKPTAEFSVPDDCQNVDAQFSDLSSVSSGSITNWDWNFGDNNFDTLQNPTHLYATDGLFSPILIVTTDNGCKDTITHTTTRYPVPNANFTYNPECLYDSLSFTDASTINAPATITNWVWNFGDGSALASEQNPKHQYNLSGTYNVTLIVSTNNGCIDDVSFPVIAYPIPEVNFTYTSVCENTPPTYFIDMSSVSNGNITAWQWDFDDGNTANTQMPSNAYTTDGIYNVELIVTSNHNCKDTTELPVTVLAKPTADFSEDKTEGCSPVCVNFQDNSLTNASSIDYWFWSYGNGDAGFDQNPSVCYENTSYTNDAVYSVTLIVKNDLGCYDTLTKTDLITSYHNPISDFVVTPDEANMYEGEITSTNNSIGADDYFWDFDNDTTSTLFEPVIHYTDTGVYNVMLVANTIHNCSDTSFQNVKIIPVISIFIPNAFTPDGDGNNDGFIFKGYGIDLATTKFYIFDRWGALIYYTENNTPWDGTYKGQKAVQDTYIYKLFCEDDFGKPHKFIGHVNLLR